MHNADTCTSTEESIFSDEEDVVQSYVLDTSPLPSDRPEISTTTTKYDVAVFQNIEAAVDEASDVATVGWILGTWLLNMMKPMMKNKGELHGFWQVDAHASC